MADLIKDSRRRGRIPVVGSAEPLDSADSDKERRARARRYANRAPWNTPSSLPRDEVKKGFARRLQRAMVLKGWNQAELARHAERILKATNPDARIGRDNVSSYVRATSLPKDNVLAALAQALGTKPEDLLPDRGIDGRTLRFIEQPPKAQEVANLPMDEAPPSEIVYLEDGNVWLRVNQAVDERTALFVVQKLNEYNAKN